MNIDVISSASEVTLDRIHGRNIIVIDVLRCTSVIVTALGNKAKNVVPVEHVEEAFDIYKTLNKGTAVLSGERNSFPIEGFDFGNSPLSYTKPNVEGKTIILTTSNGTRAISSAKTGDRVYICAFLNISEVVKQVIEDAKNITIVCSGTDNCYSMDDALCAGMIISKINTYEEVVTTDLGWSIKELYEVNRNNIHKPLENCYHYKLLKENGFEQDLMYCLQTDIFNVVPICKEGEIVCI